MQEQVMIVEAIVRGLLAVATIVLAVFSYQRHPQVEIPEGGAVAFRVRVEAECRDLVQVWIIGIIVELAVLIIVYCVFRGKTFGFEYRAGRWWYAMMFLVPFFFAVGIQAYQITLSGQTSGYRRVGICVIDGHHRPPRSLQAFVMKLCAYICLIPLGQGLFAVTETPVPRTIPDVLAGVVVRSLPNNS